jgi:hypothetical protein
MPVSAVNSTAPTFYVPLDVGAVEFTAPVPVGGGRSEHGR